MEWVGFDPRCPAAKWMCKAGTLTWFPLLRQARGVRTGEVQFCGPRACVPKDIPGGRERLGGAWGQVEEQPLCVATQEALSGWSALSPTSGGLTAGVWA